MASRLLPGAGGDRQALRAGLAPLGGTGGPHPTPHPGLAPPLKANPAGPVFFSAFPALPFAEVEKRFLALPSLPYRAAARVLTPAMKEKLRKILK